MFCHITTLVSNGLTQFAQIFITQSSERILSGKDQLSGYSLFFPKQLTMTTAVAGK